MSDDRYKPGTYYLQRGGGREFIDDFLHEGAEPIESYEAEDWKDAARQYKAANILS